MTFFLGLQHKLGASYTILNLPRASGVLRLALNVCMCIAVIFLLNYLSALLSRPSSYIIIIIHRLKIEIMHKNCK